MKNTKIYEGQSHISYPFYNYNKKERFDVNFLTQSFVDSINFRIIPYQNNNNSNFNIIFDCQDNNFKEIFYSLFQNRYNQHNIIDLIRDFAQKVVNNLFLHGYSVYELINSKDKFKLIDISSYYLKIEKKYIVQKIPKELTSLKRINKIPKNKCFYIDMKHDKLIKNLHKSFKKITEFNNNEKYSELILLQNSEELKYYDFQIHSKISEIELCKYLNFLYFTPNHCEDWNEEKFLFWHYLFLRRLRYLKNIINLRKYILELFKQILKTVSNIFDQDANLSIKGLLDLQRVDDVITQWENGEIDITAVDKFYNNS